MVTSCPNCGQALNLTDAQQQKIENALAALAPGKSLKFNCPLCAKPIEVKQEQQEQVQEPVAAAAPESEVKAKTRQEAPAAPPGVLQPPAPPDLGWLEKGDLGQGEIIEDIPLVMILIRDEAIQTDVVQLFEDMGYKAVLPHTAAEAIESMRFSSFSAVVFHSDYEGSLAESSFHEHMQGLPMTKRRYIFYVLIGPEFHSMYNLEALSNSANLVVNENEMAAFPLILKKGFRDYDELFGPYLAALEATGKK
ncbi:MAG: hypothetical protein KQH63_15255 [Desulfobulbaceae bacterium]|nr:hypothetical protein [Desulfobulbaceae bacterium]